MPEGDTIFRAARTLHRALAGQTIIRFESVFPALTRVDEDRPLSGRTIEAVSAAGKHLLMRISPDLVLRTHMRMSGSWHIYRRGERWQRPRRDMRIVIATETFEAVGFNIPVAEFLEGDRALARQEDLRQMGPDLLADRFDIAEARARLQARSDLQIADALLNQRIAAGAGNVYKSEGLFLCRINPFTRVGDLAEERLRGLLETLRAVLRANVSDQPRRTTNRIDPSQRLYVYGRAGKPCRRCGAAIRVRPQGPHARLTYWCPGCQPPVE